MSMYNDDFKNKQHVTTHKMYDTGDSFHQHHKTVYNLVQNELKKTREMTNLHGKLHKIYAGNLDYHAAAFDKGIHKFIQLMPRPTSGAKLDQTSLSSVNKALHLRKKNHHLPLHDPGANGGTTESAMCNTAYISAESSGCDNTHERVFISSNKIASMAEYYDKMVGTATKNPPLAVGDTPPPPPEVYFAMDGFNRENHDLNVSTQYTPSELQWFGQDTTAKANDLFFKTTPYTGENSIEYPAVSEGSPFVNYSTSNGPNCNAIIGNNIQLNDAIGHVKNCLDNDQIRNTITEFPSNPDPPNFYKWNINNPINKITLDATHNTLVIAADNSTIDVANSPTDPPGANNTVFDLVKNNIIIKHDKIGRISADVVGNSIAIPPSSDARNSDYIQIYTRMTSAGVIENSVAYFITETIGNEMLMKNNFAPNEIKLYARKKVVSPTDQEPCRGLSNNNTPHELTYYDSTTYNEKELLATDIQSIVSGDGLSNERTTKLCEFGTQLTIPGKYLVAIARVLQYQQKFMARELYLLNLYQYGTIVKIEGQDAAGNFKTVVPIEESVACSKVVLAGDAADYPGSCPKRFIVLPLENASGIDGVLLAADLNDAGQAASAVVLPKSNFAVVDYEKAHKNPNLMKSYSGRPLITLSQKAYSDIQEELMSNYKLVGHDIDELNKISALQEDTKVLGNKNYYMVMIYTVILFFLLGTIYMISNN